MRRRNVAALIAALALSSSVVCAPAAMAVDDTITGQTRQLAATVLPTLTVTETQEDVPGYTQTSFKYWDKQPQLGSKATTADLIMVRDFDPDTVKSTDGDVDEGVLKDPYTGLDITYHRGDGSSIDIEHVVARSEAWDSGASTWSAEKRQQFANDPLELMAVSSSGNRAHGEKDAAGWLPSKGSSFGTNASYDCKYVARQIAVKAKYGLSVDKAERQAMSSVLDTCPAQTVPLDSDGLYWADNPTSAKGSIDDLKNTRLRINGARLVGFDYTNTVIPTQKGVSGVARLSLDNLPGGWTQILGSKSTTDHETGGGTVSTPPTATLAVYDPLGNHVITYTLQADPDLYYDAANDTKREDIEAESTDATTAAADTGTQTDGSSTANTSQTGSTTSATTSPTETMADTGNTKTGKTLAVTGVNTINITVIITIIIAGIAASIITRHRRRTAHEQ